MRILRTSHALRLWPVVVALTAWSFGSAQAATLDGRFGLWTYLRDDSVDHVQVVPLLSLNVHRFGGGAWSFQSAFRGYADYQNGDANGTSAFRLNRAVLIWKPQGKRYELRAGQQWLNEGIGRGNVAGLWASYKPCPFGDFRVYAGARTPSSFSLDETTPNEGIMAGVNLQRRFGERRFGLSYSYVAKDGEVLYSGAGFDYNCTSMPDVSVRARLHYNLMQSNVETGQISAYWEASDKLMLSLDARTQAPRVFEDSFFAQFLEESKTSSVRSGGQYEFYKQFHVSGMGYLVFTEEDMLYKARAGVGCRKIELGYTHWLSAGEGDMDGFYGQIRHEYKQFEGNAGFDYSRGSNSEIRPNTEAQVIYGGVEWSPQRMIALGARIEHLKNEHFEEDWRALFSLSTSFRRALGGNQ